MGSNPVNSIKKNKASVDFGILVFFLCSTFGSTCSKLLYLCFRNTSLRLFPVDTDFKGILGVSVDIFGEYFGIGDCFSVYTS